MSSLCVAGVQSESCYLIPTAEPSECSSRPVCEIHKYSITHRLACFHRIYIYQIFILNQGSVHFFVSIKYDCFVCVQVSKIQHLLSNADISFSSLIELNDKTVSLVSEWFGSNSQSTWDIFIHTNWSEGLVHRPRSGFTTPPACPIFWACWTVMIKLSGSLPEALCFWTWGDSRLWRNRASQVCLASKRNPTLCVGFSQTDLTSVTSVEELEFLSGLNEVWPRTRPEDTITHSLTPVKDTVAQDYTASSPAAGAQRASNKQKTSFDWFKLQGK